MSETQPTNDNARANANVAESDTDPRVLEAGTDTGDFLSFDDLVSRFYEVEPNQLARVEFGALTHRGLVRETNEDHFLVTRRRRERQALLTSLPQEFLPPVEQTAYAMAVADGMGGHAFGEVASFLALRTGWDLGGEEVKWVVKVNEREAREVVEKARVFFRLIDRTLQQVAAEQPRLAGMGTTLTLCYSTGPELFVLHAGDSRAYLHRGGELQQLTRDHTLGQAMVDAGLAEPGSPAARRRKHALTNCLGGPATGLNVEVDVEHLRLRSGDRLLLCTDGLSDFVTDAEIADTLNRHPNPSDACQALVDLALSHGGKDNVTVVVAHYEFPPRSAATG